MPNEPVTTAQLEQTRAEPGRLAAAGVARRSRRRVRPRRCSIQLRRPRILRRARACALPATGRRHGAAPRDRRARALAGARGCETPSSTPTTTGRSPSLRGFGLAETRDYQLEQLRSVSAVEPAPDPPRRRGARRAHRPPRGAPAGRMGCRRARGLRRHAAAGARDVPPRDVAPRGGDSAGRVVRRGRGPPGRSSAMRG